MKNYRLYILASSVLAVASCTEFDNSLPDGDIKSQRITIEASIDVPGAQTKTYMGDADDTTKTSYPVLWSAGDQLGLISELGLSKFTIMDYEAAGVDPNYPAGSGPGTNIAKFSGNATQVVDVYPNTNVYPAAYPADKAFAETFGGNIWVGSEVPQVQIYDPAKVGFADDTFPMAAATDDPAHYHFYNMAGIIRLKVYSYEEGHRITRITLKNKSHAPISGPVAMEFSSETGRPVSSDGKDNGKAVKAWGTEGNESVMIDLSGIVVDPTDPAITGAVLPTDPNKPLIFDIAVIPQEFPNGFVVELQDGTNMGSAVWESDPLTVNRSELKEMTKMNYVAPEALGIANCYQLSEAGEYLLPSYAYGNRLDIKIGLKNGVPDPEFDSEKLDIGIYWTDIVDESGNKIDALTNLKYIKFANGINYMSFKLAKDPSSQTTLADGSLDPDSGHSYRGNVVLALYNTETNKIFWSWHMWLTDYTPQDVLIDGACASGSYDGVYPDGSPLTYRADAASGSMLIMDRNLGAVYATPANALAADEPVWKTYGLYYQDGRKDPFIGGSYNGGPNSDKESVNCKDAVVTKLHYFESDPFSTGTAATWTNPIFKERYLQDKINNGQTKVNQQWVATNAVQTLTEAIQDPQNYSFDHNKIYQWTDCGADDNQEWMVGGIHGDTGLTDGGHEAYWNRTKTIMDPCPPGYSVLGERGGYFFSGKGTSNWYADDTNGYGLMYTATSVTPKHGETTTSWWPAAGVRSWDGRMAGVGEFGYYFFYDHIKADHGGHGLIFHVNAGGGGAFNTTCNDDTIITNHATTIRCVKDKQGDYASAGKNKAPQRISAVN